jgi:hypothetical protein
MPEEAILKQIEEMQKPPKRGPGRPKGSKNKPGSKKHEFSTNYNDHVNLVNKYANYTPEE